MTISGISSSTLASPSLTPAGAATAQPTAPADGASFAQQMAALRSSHGHAQGAGGGAHHHHHHHHAGSSAQGQSQSSASSGDSLLDMLSSALATSGSSSASPAS